MISWPRSYFFVVIFAPKYLSILSVWSLETLFSCKVNFIFDEIAANRRHDLSCALAIGISYRNSFTSWLLLKVNGAQPLLDSILAPISFKGFIILFIGRLLKESSPTSSASIF